MELASAVHTILFCVNGCVFIGGLCTVVLRKRMKRSAVLNQRRQNEQQKLEFKRLQSSKVKTQKPLIIDPTLAPQSAKCGHCLHRNTPGSGSVYLQQPGRKVTALC